MLLKPDNVCIVNALFSLMASTVECSFHQKEVCDVCVYWIGRKEIQSWFQLSCKPLVTHHTPWASIYSSVKWVGRSSLLEVWCLNQQHQHHLETF